MQDFGEEQAALRVSAERGGAAVAGGGVVNGHRDKGRLHLPSVMTFLPNIETLYEFSNRNYWMVFLDLLSHLVFLTDNCRVSDFEHHTQKSKLINLQSPISNRDRDRELNPPKISLV